MTAPDATPARGDVDVDDLADTITASMVADDRQSAAEFRKGCSALRALLDHITTLTAERDALAQLVRVLEAGPDDAACDRVIKMVSGGGMWALINNETKREYLRTALRATPEAPDA